MTDTIITYAPVLIVLGASSGFVYGKFVPGSGAACSSNLIAAFVVLAALAWITGQYGVLAGFIAVFVVVALLAGRSIGRHQRKLALVLAEHR